MPAAKETHGYKSRNAWEVALYVQENQELYNEARELTERMGHTNAAKILAKRLKGKRTPGGHRVNFSSLRAALYDMTKEA